MLELNVLLITYNCGQMKLYIRIYCIINIIRIVCNLCNAHYMSRFFHSFSIFSYLIDRINM